MKKILIAEDDNFLASAYRLKLTKAGFDVQIVEDGEKLISALSVSAPDLILLDLIMPVMDGFKALEIISTYQKYKSIPVIIASNLGQKEDIDRALMLGAKDFVVKSDLSLDKLIEKINKLIA